MNRDTFPKNVVLTDDNFSDCFWAGSMLWLPANNCVFTDLIVGANCYPSFDDGTTSNSAVVPKRYTGFESDNILMTSMTKHI